MHQNNEIVGTNAFLIIIYWCINLITRYAHGEAQPTALPGQGHVDKPTIGSIVELCQDTLYIRGSRPTASSSHLAFILMSFGFWNRGAQNNIFFLKTDGIL